MARLLWARLAAGPPVLVSPLCLLGQDAPSCTTEPGAFELCWVFVGPTTSRGLWERTKQPAVRQDKLLNQMLAKASGATIPKRRWTWALKGKLIINLS